MAETEVRLRTPEEVAQAYEWLFNRQREGKIDSKSADSLNTTLKGVTYLRAKLRMDMAKLIITAQIKKVEIPHNLLADIVGPQTEGLPGKKPPVRVEAKRAEAEA